MTYILFFLYFYCYLIHILIFILCVVGMDVCFYVFIYIENVHSNTQHLLCTENVNVSFFFHLFPSHSMLLLPNCSMAVMIQVNMFTHISIHSSMNSYENGMNKMVCLYILYGEKSHRKTKTLIYVIFFSSFWHLKLDSFVSEAFYLRYNDSFFLSISLCLFFLSLTLQNM